MNSFLPNDLAVVKKKLDCISPSFCLAKWLQTTLLLQNGIRYSCHHARGEIIHLPEIATIPSNLHNTNHSKKIRKAMLGGKRPVECSYCWNLEKLGRTSDRIIKSASDWALPFLDKIINTGAGSDINPSYLEVSFGNSCNLTCAYCRPESSSSWLREVELYGPYPTSRNYRSLKYLHKKGILPVESPRSASLLEAFWRWWPTLVKDLRVFRITGGEPLLSPAAWKAMNMIANGNHLDLNFEINSNLSLPTGLINKLISIANSMEKNIAGFLLHVSIDTVGKQAEYIRYGLEENLFFENLEMFLQKARPHIKINYIITISALSLSGLEQLLTKIVAQRRRYPHLEIYIDFPYLLNPEFLSLQILPPEFDFYFDRLLTFMTNLENDRFGFTTTDIEKIRRLRNWAFEPQSRWRKRKLRKDFKAMIQEYDKRKKLDFLQLFPELRSLWQAI